MRPVAQVVLLLATAVVSQGCATGCDAYAAPGLSIRARDAITGTSINRGDVRVILQAEGQADTTKALPNSLAWESPGTYTVVIDVPGYERWERTNIRVTKDDCHVKTVQVVADLRPTSAP